MSSKRKYCFQQVTIGTCVIPRFHAILTGKSIYSIILGFRGDLQGLKVNFEVKYVKSISFKKHK